MRKINKLRLIDIIVYSLFTLGIVLMCILYVINKQFMWPPVVIAVLKGIEFILVMYVKIKNIRSNEIPTMYS